MLRKMILGVKGITQFSLRFHTLELSQWLIGRVAYLRRLKDMTAPTKEFEKLVMSGKLRHGGHAVLRWMASNVAVETDAAGNLKPSKKKSTERIDGIVAAVMVLGRLLVQPVQKSVYYTRGIIWI